jgi:hypothetical protein
MNHKPSPLKQIEATAAICFLVYGMLAKIPLERILDETKVIAPFYPAYHHLIASWPGVQRSDKFTG